MNVVAILEETVRRFPDKTAMIYAPTDEHISFCELDARASRFAHGLVSLGVSKGDRVGIYATNRPEWWTAYLGILKAGATVVPMNFLLKSKEIQHIAAHSQLSTLVTESHLRPEIDVVLTTLSDLRTIVYLDEPAGPAGDAVVAPARFAGCPAAFPAVDCDGDDTASIIYTSGTTGVPKGAMLTHANLGWSVTKIARASLELESSDTWVQVVPLAHVSGQMWGMSVLVSGGTLVRMDKFEVKEYCRVVQHYRATASDGVVTIVLNLLAYPEADGYVGTLKRIADGGAPMPPDAFEAFERRFKAKIVDFYGLTESTLLAVHLQMNAPRRRGSCGYAAPETSIRILDDDGNEMPTGTEGEIALRGPQIMKGYWRNPEATQQVLRDGWFRTGDIGKVDADGYLYIVDRKKDIILMSGWSIFPREVEDVLVSHPQVLEAAVVAIPDAARGEIPIAVIVPKAGERIDPQELIQFCRARMAVYKSPRFIEFTESLPKAGGGWKILKRDLREIYARKYVGTGAA